MSNSIEHRIIKKTPATTKVAAWISAETGVGPSIASGNQICNGICADFPNTPQKSKKAIMVNALKSKQKNEMVLFKTQGTNANVVK